MATNSTRKTAANTTKVRAPRKTAAKPAPLLLLTMSESAVDDEVVIESAVDDEVVIESAPADEVVIDTPVAEVIEDAVIVAEKVVAEVDGMDDLDKALAALGMDTMTVEAVTIEQPIAHTEDELVAAVGAVEGIEAAVAAATVETVEPAAAPTEGEVASGPVVTPEEPTAEKKPRTPRVHYTDKTERLRARVGSELGEFAVLTVSDAETVTDDASLAVALETTIQIIKGMNKKEQSRATGFIEYLAGKRAGLNNVLKITLEVLARDGKITTGKDGNVFKALLAVPYTLGAARAMGGNTLGMYEDLRVINRDEKGVFTANPDSLLLMKAMSMIETATVEPVTPAAEPGAIPTISEEPPEVVLDDLVAALGTLHEPVVETVSETEAELVA